MSSIACIYIWIYAYCTYTIGSICVCWSWMFHCCVHVSYSIAHGYKKKKKHTHSDTHSDTHNAKITKHSEKINNNKFFFFLQCPFDSTCTSFCNAESEGTGLIRRGGLLRCHAIWSAFSLIEGGNNINTPKMSKICVSSRNQMIAASINSTTVMEPRTIMVTRRSVKFSRFEQRSTLSMLSFIWFFF